jgi:hypothetical protein
MSKISEEEWAEWFASMKAATEKMVVSRVEEHVAEVKRAAEKERQKTIADTLFRLFLKDRVRQPTTFVERLECIEDPTTTNRIKTAVYSWRKDNRVELSMSYVIDRLTAMFGEPKNGKEWPTIKVFHNEMFVEDWDVSHAS